MKLTLKIFGVLLIIIIAIMLTVPYFFRDQIAQAVKEEINNNLNAQVDFSDFSLSLIKSFPDFNFTLEDLSIVNNEPFAGDTLASVPSLSLTLGLMSVIKGDAYEVKKLHFQEPRINALVNEDGAANWDIALPSEDDGSSSETDGDEPFLVKLRKVTIGNAHIVYDDKTKIDQSVV